MGSEKKKGERLGVEIDKGTGKSMRTRLSNLPFSKLVSTHEVSSVI